MKTATAHRPLYRIADDIATDWLRVNYAALPYLEAMYSLDTIHDRYLEDGAVEIIIRFLGNAGSWRGSRARQIKAELKSMVGL